MSKVRLTDICRPKQWKTLPVSSLKDKGFPVYGANGKIGYYNEYNHEDETVLITCRGATCGTINISEPFSYINGNAMCLDNLSENVNIRYLYYLLNGIDFKNIISGSAQPQITREGLQKLYINIPEIQEQLRIVKIFDRLCWIIGRKTEQKNKLDELIKSRFVEMFRDNKYPNVKTRDICDFITKGTTPPSNEIFSDFSEDRIPYLKVYNLSFTGELLFEQEPQYISKKTHYGTLSRSIVFPNDVLMNIVGPPLGKFSVVTDEYSEWNINQAIAIFRAKEKIIPVYLMYALMQPEVLRPFLEQAVGIRQLNLSLEQCRNLEIPLPPINLQNQFADFVEQINKQKTDVQKSIEKLEILKKSLMQEYFG